MRFVWAVAAFVLAALMIGAGIAQRTVFQGPKTETASISVEEDAPYLLIDGAVLNQLPGDQTLRAQGEGDIFAAYGRTADMEAWLSDTTYNACHADRRRRGRDDRRRAGGRRDRRRRRPRRAAAEGATPEDTAADAAADAPGRSPVGSDLWLDEFQQTDILIAPLSFRPR